MQKNSKNYNKYFKIISDNRNLNYDKYFSRGTKINKMLKDYTSENTKRLSTKETIKILKNIISKKYN